MSLQRTRPGARRPPNQSEGDSPEDSDTGEDTSSPGASDSTAGAPDSDAPSGPTSGPGSLKREYTRLLSLQEHLRMQVELIQREMETPTARAIIDEVRVATPSEIPDTLRDVADTIADAVAVLAEGESELREILETDPGSILLDGVANLPVRLARFIADRKDLPGFSYEIRQDDVRGWIIAWKEYGANGIVRGSGQFYERPYAWLDE